MLEPLKHVLSSHRIVLASGSPRRKEILSNSGLGGKFEIIPSTAEENLDRTLPVYKENPWKFAEDTAQLKAEEVFERLQKENGELTTMENSWPKKLNEMSMPATTSISRNFFLYYWDQKVTKHPVLKWDFFLAFVRDAVDTVCYFGLCQFLFHYK